MTSGPSKSYVEAMKALQDKVRTCELLVEEKKQEIDSLNNFWEDKLQILLEESERLRQIERENSILIENLDNERKREAASNRKLQVQLDRLMPELADAKESNKKLLKERDGLQRDKTLHKERSELLQKELEEVRKLLDTAMDTSESLQRRLLETESKLEKAAESLISSKNLNSKYSSCEIGCRATSTRPTSSATGSRSRSKPKKTCRPVSKRRFQLLRAIERKRSMPAKSASKQNNWQKPRCSS